MNIIIVAHPNASARTLHLGTARLRWLIGGSAALVLFALLGLGAWLGASWFGPEQLRVTLRDARAEIAQQQAEVSRLNEVMVRDMGAMAVKLGRLQAASTRMNALGERLAKLGKLDDGEFNFANEPDLGGPGPGSTATAVAPDQFSGELVRLQRQMQQQTQQLSVLERLLEDRSIDRSLTPAGIPLRSGYISSQYGNRIDPIDGSREFHSGIDFDANMGDDILAVAGGVISFVGTKSGYGNVTEIDHGNGYVTRYAHNSRNLLAVGDPVRPGDVIAKVGSTGRSTGTHVHFEVWDNGRLVNPNTFVKGTR